MNPSAFPATLELRCAPITAVELALYAAASGDHNPLHLDADVARKAGFERPVVHGMLTMAHVARLFTSTFGAGCLQALHTRFNGVLLRDDCPLVEATLTEQDDRSAQYALRVRTASGTEVVTGTARVRSPAR